MSTKLLPNRIFTGPHALIRRLTYFVSCLSAPFCITTSNIATNIDHFGRYQHRCLVDEAPLLFQDPWRPRMTQPRVLGRVSYPHLWIVLHSASRRDMFPRYLPICSIFVWREERSGGNRLIWATRTESWLYRLMVIVKLSEYLNSLKILDLGTYTTHIFEWNI